MGCARIVCSKADSPNAIHRTSLNEHAVVGAEQEVAQWHVLSKFFEVATNNYLHADSLPAFVVKASDSSPQILGRAGCRSHKDALVCFRVTEKLSLSGHHEVFRGRERL